jgi:hypothetical protein
MTATNHAIQFVAIMSMSFIVRWLHLEYRAPESGSEGLLSYAVLGLLFVVVAAVMGSPPRTTRTSTAFVSAMTAALVGLGLAATMQLFFPDSLPRFSLLVMTVFVFAWLFITGAIAAWNSRRLGEADRIVAVVSDSDATALASESISTKLERPFLVVDTITALSNFGSISMYVLPAYLKAIVGTT